MTSTKTLSIAIDPSGTETGGRVVKRVIDEVAASATKAEKSVDSLASKSGQAMRGVGDSVQHAGREMKNFRASTGDVERAMAQMTRSAGLASFQQRNLAFQLNDVFQSFALGMPVTQILLQQGPQLAQIYGPGEGGIGRAFKETATMATALVARLWPLAAAAAGVYGAYRLISSYSVTARTDVDALTRSMAGQAMSASSLQGAVSDFTTAQGALIDAVGVKGAIGELITLQGNYGAAISATATIQTSASMSIVADLKREYDAKRQLLEVESQLQQAKLATMRADLAAKTVQLKEEIGDTVFTRGDLVAQGFEDPRVGRLTQLPDSVSGLAKLQEQIAKNPLSLEIKKMQAELTLAEVAANHLNAALGKSFEGAAVQNGLEGLSKLSATSFSQAAQGANSFSTAVSGIATATQSANNGVINVTEAMAKARRQTLATMQQSTAQVRTMKTELADIQATLAAAGNIPADSIFGKNLMGNAATDALAKAAVNIEKVMTALGKGGMVASTAHEAIEMVRASLIQMGGDTKAVNLLIDSLVAGHMRAMDLKGAIDQVSQSIMGIPNRVINIGIRQYTVGATGGGTKNINVYGSGADMTQTQYNVGGKTIGVSSGNGAAVVTKGYYYDQPGDLQAIDDMYGTNYAGARAAGGPVAGGKQYLVGENGPELVTMGGAGNVTNTNSTASILSGGRDTLSLIEDHLYSVMQELRIHTNYWETAESNAAEMITCLKAIKSVQSSSSSYGGSSGGSSSSSRGSFAGGSSKNGGNVVDYNSVYADVGLGFYSGHVQPAFMPYSIAPGKTGVNNVINPYLHKNGFATGGQIMPGEDQRVEFFKKNTERVIIVDDAKVSDGRGGRQQAPKAERPIQIINNFHGDVGDPRSRQAMEDQFRRAVQQVGRS